MKTTIIYHRVDFDGVFSACIAKYYYEEILKEEVNLFGWNYSDSVPNIESDNIIMVDLMFPPEDMIRLKKTKNLVVIDHHESNINSSIKFGYDNLPGIRSYGKGACELCWEYYFNNTPCPKIIGLLSSYDVWDHDRFNWKDETSPLQLALKAKYGVSVDIIYPEFKKMIEPGYDFKELIRGGKLIQEYEYKQFAWACKSYVFPVTVAGKFRGAACLTHTFGSRLFESVKDNYDVFITLNRKEDPDGNPIFAMGLYSDGGIGNFSLAQYVRDKYGDDRGGGHPMACGCWITLDEFIEIITTNRV